MLKLYLGKFYFEAGTSIGFLTDDKYVFKAGYRLFDEYSNLIGAGTVETSGKTNVRSTRFSLPVGVGYDFSLEKFRIFVEGKYDIGLTNVTKEDNWKVSSFQLLLGLRYGF